MLLSFRDRMPSALAVGPSSYVCLDLSNYLTDCDAVIQEENVIQEVIQEEDRVIQEEGFYGYNMYLYV
jgi:hypothetical protein